MSNAIFPTFPGVAWPIGRSPMWSTQVRESASGRQYALSKRLYPLWHFKLPFEVLRASGGFTEWQQLVGFINARRGRYDDWLYQHPRDCTVADQVFAVGDGASKTFTLVRTLGGFVEPVGGVDTATAVVKVAGVVTAVTFSSDLAQVTFATAPALGASLTWSGTFYFRCRFLQDEIAIDEFMANLYSARSVEFRTFRP